MGSMSKQKLIEHVDNLIGFLEPWWPLANCHMVDYFTESAYVQYVPKVIRDEIEQIGQLNVIQSIFDDDVTTAFNEGAPKLNQYLASSKSLTLENSSISLSRDMFYTKFNCYDNPLLLSNMDLVKKQKFMSAKKLHEVERMSRMTVAIQRISNTTHIVDIGDGKGYLSSLLASHYRVPVLGVDASPINTCGAARRATKLCRVTRNTTTLDLYKQVTLFVNKTVDFKRLLSDMYRIEERPERVSLVGLHTCGDLSATSIRIFLSNPAIRSLCNVACCYHLLTTNDDDDDGGGFPMSTHLQLTRRIINIDKNARMIAAQSPDRIRFRRELPSTQIFYRALLQVLLRNKYSGANLEKRVGKFRKPAVSFRDYVQRALQRLDIIVDCDDALTTEIDDLLAIYQERVDELNVFYLIRSMLAPVIESLLLLDRLLFLYEMGYDQSFLVHLFDPVISPRCYALIAIK